MIDAACENIKQGRFTSTTGTHNRVDFSGLENTTDVFENGFFDGTFLARDFAFDSFIRYLDRVRDVFEQDIDSTGFFLIHEGFFSIGD
jgi:hypothetical protein